MRRAPNNSLQPTAASRRGFIFLLLHTISAPVTPVLGGGG